jgi:hypothetical protein
MRIIVVSLVADFIALNLLYECVNVVRYGSHFWLQEKMCIKKGKGERVSVPQDGAEFGGLPKGVRRKS